MSNSNPQDYINAFKAFGGAFKYKGDKRNISLALKEGYVFLRSKAAIDVFLSDSRYKDWSMETFEDGFKFYPPNDLIDNLFSLKSVETRELCGVVRLNKANKPLYLSITKKSKDNWNYVLSYFDDSKDNFEIINSDNIKCSFDDIIVALPLLLEDVKVNDDAEIMVETSNMSKSSIKGGIILKELNKEETKRVERLKRSLVMFKDGVKMSKEIKVEEKKSIDDLLDSSNYNPANDNFLFQQHIMSELLEKGYISCDSDLTARKVLNDPRYRDMVLREVDGEYRIVPVTKELTELGEFISNKQAALLCTIVRTNRKRPLSMLINKKNDEECIVELSEFNCETKKYDVLGTYNISYDNELFVKTLPMLYYDSSRELTSLIVLEQGNEFDYELKYAKNSMMIFRGFDSQDQNTIVGMKQFVDRNKTQDENVKCENVILTGKKKNLAEQFDEKREKVLAEDMIRAFDILSVKYKGALYVTISDRGDGYYNYKLETYDEASRSIMKLYEAPVHSLGLFTSEVLPYVVNKLEGRGKVLKNAFINSFDINTIICNPDLVKVNQIILIGFTKEKINELNTKLFPNTKETHEKLEKAKWSPVDENMEYKEYILEQIKSKGYLEFNNEEMEEFSRISEYNYFDRTYKDGKWIVYPSLRELSLYDNDINSNIASNIINCMNNNYGNLSFVVTCLPDGTCNIKLEKLNQHKMILEKLLESRVLFNGNFLYNVLRLVNEVFSVNGKTETISLDLTDRSKALNVDIFKNMNSFVFYGLNDEQKEEVSKVLGMEVNDKFVL